MVIVIGEFYVFFKIAKDFFVLETVLQFSAVSVLHMTLTKAFCCVIDTLL